MAFRSFSWLVALVIVGLACGESMARPGGGGRPGGASGGARPEGAGPANGPGAGSNFGPGGGAGNFGPQNGVQPRNFSGPANVSPQNGFGRSPNAGEVQGFLNQPNNNLPNNGAARANANNLPGRAAFQQGQFTNRANSLAHYAPATQPFTGQWYAQHPTAWQTTHPNADAWAVANYGTAARWVGVAALTPNVYAPAYVYDSTGTAASNTESVEDAEQLADTGAKTADDAQWLPLGVFGLIPPSGNGAQQMVQLVISKEGQINGTYYDVLGDNQQNVTGSLDRDSQRVAFRAGGTNGALFETSLNNLTLDESPIVVHFANGKAQQWTLVRMKK